jgi:phosphatidate cytidylyltransferase
MNYLNALSKNMALNKAVFKTRTLTAAVFVAVMLAGLLWNMWSFFLLLSVIHFGAWFEYLKLTEVMHKTKIDIVIKYFFATCGFTLFIVLGFQHWGADMYMEIFGYHVSFKIITWIFMFLSLLIFIFQNKQIPNNVKKMMMLGFVYITIPLGLLLFLKDRFHFTLELDGSNVLGKLIPCAIFLSIWANDTMAYLVGSFIGKTPFTKISPKKTLEGTIGGIIMCVLIMGLFGYFVPAAKALALQHWLCIAAICAIFGTIGDLVESKIKRLAGVKDSGSFMPGHGGFLDRFDSLLVAVPFVWLYVQSFVL